MLLTESEAKEKWCPHVRKGEDNCVASQCMMWRVFDAQYMQGEINNDRRGYCGLAGEVEYTLNVKKA